MNLATDDRLDILDLLARADAAATRRDVDAYVALFTDDGLLDGEKGKHRGRQALADAVGRVWDSEGPASVHLTLNALIDAQPDQEGRVTARSVLLIVAPGPPPVLKVVAGVVQHLERTPAGWRIARRTVGGP